MAFRLGDGRCYEKFEDAKRAAENYFKDTGVVLAIERFDPCRCGSGQERRPLSDARGIFVCYVCDACEEKVKARYRPDIFEDPGYWTDEPVEEDY